ncbi:MAG: anaerobic ribonucleoside-triphosphate reductase activating protein, partial [Clostridia bacterium]|nr:anaerobic ribonucleoside-triphosphate reductase activating protein [Clostridia bacterium]
MTVNGLLKLTLLDFPGKCACTVFFAGCNFRCPFCHNASLVLGEGESISEEEFFKFLSKREGVLEGVAVTGGEPLMQRELPLFLKRIKEKGFLVKLDTNGSFPKRLRERCSEGLVDYVAMDIKSSPEGYSRAAGCPVNIENVKESVEFLLSGAVDYEFRTTVAKGAVLFEDMEGIGRLIKGAKRYFLQGFVDSGDLLGSGTGPYTKDEME